MATLRVCGSKAAWVAVLGLLVLGCGCGGGGGGGEVKPASVLMVGSYQTIPEYLSHPCYWTDRGGPAIELPLPEGAHAGAAHAVVKTNDAIVILGTAGIRPVYWTGVVGGSFTVSPIAMPAGMAGCYPSAAAVQDGQVRAVGSCYSGDWTGSRAEYWSSLDEPPAELPAPELDSYAAALAIDDASNVYVGGGYESSLSVSLPYAWKNGVALSPLPVNSGFFSAGAIYAIGIGDGGVVLAGTCGTRSGGACVWTEGSATATVISDSYVPWAAVVIGGVVHLAGSGVSNAAHWESPSSQPRVLSPADVPEWRSAAVYAGALANGALVLAGSWTDATGRWQPGYWATPDAPAMSLLPLPRDATLGQVNGILAL